MQQPKEIQQAQERGFKTILEYYQYKVNLKHQLRKKGLEITKETTLLEMENLLETEEIKTNKDFFFNKIFIDNNIERLF